MADKKRTKKDSPIEKARAALSLKNPERICEALRSLSASSAPEALTVYLQAFESPFWMVRELASMLLSGTGDSGRKFIEHNLNELSPSQAYWCVKALEAYRQDGLGLIIRFLKAEDKEVRRVAIETIAKLDVEQILSPLIERLDDPVWTNREAAAAALEAKASTLPVLDKISKAVKTGNENVRYWILRIISRLIGSDGSNPVHKFLRDNSVRTRCAALSAMGNMVDQASIPLLISHLNDPLWIVRRAAAQALEARGEDVEGFLKSAFREGSHEMKFWAIRVLARLQGKKRIATYRSFIQGQVEELKYYGMEALGEIHCPEAISLLLDCFQDPSWNVRQFASEQVANIGMAAVSMLVERCAAADESDHDTRYWAVRSLFEMGEGGVGPLVTLLASPDREVRATVLSVLSPPMSRQLLSALERLLDDSDVWLQKGAARLLQQQGLTATPCLVEGMFAEPSNRRYWVRKITAGWANENLERLMEEGERHELFSQKVRSYLANATNSELMAHLNGSWDNLKDRVDCAQAAGDLSGVAMLDTFSTGEGQGLFAPGSQYSQSVNMQVASSTIGSLKAMWEERKAREAAVDGESPSESALRPMTGTELDHFLRLLKEREGSDLHMSPNSRPVMRIHGELIMLEEYEPLSKSAIERVLTSNLTTEQKRKLERDLTLDCSYEIEGVARFRVNLLYQRRGLNGVYRIIPTRIPSFAELQLPDTLRRLCALKQGIVLITGPTGSGKSSTVASMIDFINQTRKEHIITIEDPIEFVHNNRECLITQREVGPHCHSFVSALRSALREDPDIILVGEMRDLETISLAITAAETGHLVFSTLHTTTAAQTIDRVVDAYPPHQQAQIRVQLANSLQAVVAQRLLPRGDGRGRHPAIEILIRTHGIANLIREGRTEQLFSQLQTGRELGMQTIDDDMLRLVKGGIIRYEDAVEFAYDRKTFEKQGKRLINPNMLSSPDLDVGRVKKLK